MALDNRLLARIARTGGGKLLDRAAGKLFLAVTGAADTPRPKRTITGAIAGAALTRIATRSAPGAILVGGAMLAKALYDRRREHLARRKEADAEEAGDGKS